MKTLIQIFFLLFVLFLFSCIPSSHKPIKTSQPIDYILLSKSNYFNEKHIAFTLDSLDNAIHVKLHLNKMNGFPFPIDSKHKDTLWSTVMHFDFTCNGENILSDYHKIKNTTTQNHFYTIDSIRVNENLNYISDTIFIRDGIDVEYDIPLFAFHSLAKGKHTIELSMWQDSFFGSNTIVNKDSTRTSYYMQAKKSLLNARVKFDLGIPTLYKSTIYGYGLQLKNDSTFSPAGMDVTLFQSSYPDIYWTIYYPLDNDYAATNYQKSTDKYTDKDTFTIYHYSPNDSIGIGVWDHDNLSSPDGLGFWEGDFNYLRRTPPRRISFGNVKWFDIKMDEAKKIN